MALNICKFPDCNNKAITREYCTACYYRLLRQGVIKKNTSTQKWRHRLSNIDVTTGTANCSTCGKTKIFPRSKDGLQWRCGTEANARKRSFEHKAYAVKKAQLIDHCEICGAKDKLRWDHNHDTGKFRGTLCNRCNMAIGLFGENATFLLNAAEYIKVKNDESCTS